MEGEQESAPKLTNGTSLNDLQWLFSKSVTIVQRQITLKWYNTELYLQWPTNRKSYMIHWTVPFSMTLNDPYPGFKVTRFFNAEYLSNSSTRYIQFQWIADSNLDTPYSTVSFRMTLSDLAKYSIKWSDARSLCDSWASCIAVWNNSTQCICNWME